MNNENINKNLQTHECRLKSSLVEMMMKTEATKVSINNRCNIQQERSAVISAEEAHVSITNTVLITEEMKVGCGLWVVGWKITEIATDKNAGNCGLQM
jgi:hypothetical protein